MRLATFTFLAATGAAACGGDDADPAIDGAIAIDAGPAGDGGGDARTQVGTLRVIEDRYLYDRKGELGETRTAHAWGWYVATPPPTWHKQVAQAGDCRLLTFTPASCEPGCDGEVCVDTNVCVPPVRYQSAGALTLTGLRGTVSMAGAADGYYYDDANALPADLFADDTTVTARFAGAAVPAHTLTAGGVASLEAAIPLGRITLTPGQDHTLRWTPSAGDARVALTLNANNSGHGAPYHGIIECDAADAAGQITIAAALVDGFPPTQAWTHCAGHDCPPSTLLRYHRTVTAVGDQDAELIVGSQISFGVVHEP